MQLELTIQVWREGTQFVAHAMPLDVMSSGATAEAARQALDEAVQCFVQTAEGKGSLDEILEECGYSKNNGVWASPAWVGIERRAVAL